MKKLLRFIGLLFFLALPSITFASDIEGKGWIASYLDGSKQIILFEKDNTFTYLNIYSPSGGQGEVYSDDQDTWKLTENKNLLVLSFTNGYMLCSVRKENWKIMTGDCINKQGFVERVNLKLIE